MAKVYICCHHSDPANQLRDALTYAGHEVVSTWHAGPGPRPADTDSAAWQEKADNNFQQITTADALVVIASLDHIARIKCVPGGKFVEAGYALGYGGVKVFTLGGVEN